MNNILKQLTPRDIIAILVLIGGGILLCLGVDSFVTAIMALVVGFYFGHRRPFIK